MLPQIVRSLLNIKFLHYHSTKIARNISYKKRKYLHLIRIIFSSLAMGTPNIYCLFTINQENKMDEIHSCGKNNILKLYRLP